VNIRSLTRGDGVVIGAALLLFIASFLDLADIGDNDYGITSPSAWDNLALALGVYLGGVIAAALIVVNRCLPQPRKVAGHDLGTVGVAFTVFVFWYLLWMLIDSDGVAGAGLVLGFIAALLLAGGAVAGSMVAALKAPLINATPRPAPQPYGAQAPQGYGYPGAQQSQFGGQPQPGPQGGPQQPSPEFSPFWFAVPAPRALYAEDGSPTQIAELAPGVWYLAVDQRGPGLIAQTQDGRRGLLQDSSGIQRG
jgi:hypothetical protein